VITMWIKWHALRLWRYVRLRCLECGGRLVAEGGTARRCSSCGTPWIVG
jgi:tRNA(Ile2) C34 agmatinyltransferase TiaS